MPAQASTISCDDPTETEGGDEGVIARFEVPTDD
jgi:hypothetical protein